MTGTEKRGRPTEIIKALIENGADVNERSRSRETALMWAAVDGHTDAIKVLIKNGADVNAWSKGKETALTVASAGGWTEVAKFLIENGALPLIELQQNKKSSSRARDGNYVQRTLDLS